jgi:hypothetical protein
MDETKSTEARKPVLSRGAMVRAQAKTHRKTSF